MTIGDMDWTVWILFVLTEGALTVTPGPAVLFVVAQGLRTQSTNAIHAAGGILSVNAAYFAISGTGVGALLVASSGVFTAVRWAGAAYLVYLGAMALVRPQPAGEPEAAARGASVGGTTLFARGALLQLSNPKALLFFVAVLPQFIDRGRPVVFQLLVFGLTSIVLEFVVLAAYARAAARTARLATHPRFAAGARRFGGALLIAAALGLVRANASPE
jgi:threonine/homoserine/homoserine lactone efflux protein